MDPHFDISQLVLPLDQFPQEAISEKNTLEIFGILEPICQHPQPGWAHAIQ